MSDQLESTPVAAYEAGDLHGEDGKNAAEEHHEVVEETMTKKEVSGNEAVSMQGLEDTVKGILQDIGVPEEKISQLSQVKETVVKGISDTVENVKSGLVKHDEHSPHPEHEASDEHSSHPEHEASDEHSPHPEHEASESEQEHKPVEAEHKHKPEESQHEQKPEAPEHKHESEEHQEETDAFNFVSGIAGALKQRLEETKHADSKHKEEENKVEQHEARHEEAKPVRGLEDVVSSLTNVIQEGFEQVKKTVEENTDKKEHKEEHKEQDVHEKDEKLEEKKEDKRESRLEDLATDLAGALKEGFEHVKEAVGQKISEEDLKHDNSEHKKKEAHEEKRSEEKPNSGFGELLTDVGDKLQQGFEHVKQIVDEKVDEKYPEGEHKESSEEKHDEEVHEETKEEIQPQMGFNEFVSGVRSAIRDEMEHLKETFEQKVTAEEEDEEKPMVKHTVAEGVNVPTHVETVVKKAHVEAKPNTEEKSHDPMKDVLQGLGISEESIQKVAEVKDTVVKGIIEKVEDFKEDLKKHVEEVKGTHDEEEHEGKTDKEDVISAEGSEIKSRLEGIASDVKKGMEDLLGYGVPEKHEGSVEKTKEDACLVSAENKPEKNFEEDIDEKFEKVITTGLTNVDKEGSKQGKMESTDVSHVEESEHHEQEHKEHHEEASHIEEHIETAAVVPPHSPIHDAKTEQYAEEKRFEKPIDEEIHESAHTKEKPYYTAGDHITVFDSGANDLSAGMKPKNDEAVPVQSAAPGFIPENSSPSSMEASKEQDSTQTIPVIFEDIPATASKTPDGFKYPVTLGVGLSFTPIPVQFEEASTSGTCCEPPQVAAPIVDHSFAPSFRDQSQVMPTLFENPPSSIEQGPSQMIPVIFEDAPTFTEEDSCQSIPVKFEDSSTTCEHENSQVIPVKFESDDVQNIPVNFASTPKRKHKQIGPLHAQTMPVAFTNPSRPVVSDSQEDSATLPVTFETDDEDDSQTTSSECGKRRWSKRGSSFEDFPPSAYLQQKMSMDIGIVNTTNLPEELIPLGDELQRCRQNGILRHGDSHDSQNTSNDGEMLIETVYFDEDEGTQIPVHFEEPPDPTMMESDTLREADIDGTLIPVQFDQQPQGSFRGTNMHAYDMTECSESTHIPAIMVEPMGNSKFDTIIEQKRIGHNGITLNDRNASHISDCEEKIENNTNEINEEKNRNIFTSIDEKDDFTELFMKKDTPIAVIFEDRNMQNERFASTIEQRPEEIHAEMKIINELDDVHVDDILKSVPSPTVCEQLPSAVVEAVPENVLKFSAAPAVHHSAPHATVESPLQHETSVTKTEVKPIMTSSHAEPEKKHEEHKAEVREESHEKPRAEVKKEKHEESEAEVKQEKHELSEAEVKDEKHEEHEDEGKQESSASAPPLPKSPPPPVPPKTKSIDMTTKEFEERVLRGEPTEMLEETTKLQFKPIVKTSNEPQHSPAEPEKPKESEHKPEPPKEHKEEPVPPKQHEPLPPVVSKPEKSEGPLPAAAPKPKEPAPVPAPAPTIAPPKVEKPKEPEPKKTEHDVGEVVEKKHFAPLTTTTTTTSAAQPSATAVPKQESKKPATPPSEQIQPSATATTTTKVEQSKDSESHEVETNASTQPQSESQPQSAISQKTESIPAEKVEEALVEIGKSDTLKSKSGESTNGQQQQQQQPARRRCTIL